MNRKVLFIVHDVYQEDNMFPVGAGYLAAMLRGEGAEVQIYCQDVYHYTNKQLAEFLNKNEFDIIGLGFLAARFKETVLPLCRVINRHKKNAWLVLGGPCATAIPEYTLAKTGADIIVLGEAEETIVELLRARLYENSLSEIKGISYTTEEQIKVNERRENIKYLDMIPFPAWDLFPMDIYTTNMQFFGMSATDRAFAILTKRGCYNRCNFCYRMEEGIRTRSIEDVIREIEMLNKEYKVTYFNMLDELFTFPKQWIFDFRDALEEEKLDIKFACQARVDIIDREFAKCLKDCGCKFLSFGMESSDQEVLDLMNKNTTVKQNIDAARITRNAGIGVGLNFIWNNKGDTKKSLRDNVALIKKHNTYDQLRTIRPVTPYPGCDLYNEAIESGLLKDADDFFNKFINSDLITVNFMGIPDQEAHKALFDANRELIRDHFQHKADEMISSFSNLYFKNNASFRGARHYGKAE